MSNDHDSLLGPYRLTEAITLKNRIVMAPMTRVKASADFVPTQAMAQYYARRAEAGLIVTEGTVISRDARGHDFVPGIFNADQIEGWRQVTDAVHQQGGLIFCQLWHVGRVSHPYFLEGKLPMSASATVMTGKISRSQGLMFGAARAATEKDIAALLAHYEAAAKNAMAAGFDGVEIHGANGYLLDQFLHYHTNHRDDEYGGHPENMARLPLAVVKTCGAAIGYERVAIRLSPGAYLNEVVGDERDVMVFQYLLQQLSVLPIAYTHTGCFEHLKTFPALGGLTMAHFMRRHYQGTLVAAGSYEVAEALRGVKENHFDLVAFGRPFIANPDLVSRLKAGQALLPYDVSMLQELY